MRQREEPARPARDQLAKVQLPPGRAVSLPLLHNHDQNSLHERIDLGSFCGIEPSEERP